MSFGGGFDFGSLDFGSLEGLAALGEGLAGLGNLGVGGVGPSDSGSVVDQTIVSFPPLGVTIPGWGTSVGPSQSQFDSRPSATSDQARMAFGRAETDRLRSEFKQSAAFGGVLKPFRDRLLAAMSIGGDTGVRAGRTREGGRITNPILQPQQTASSQLELNRLFQRAGVTPPRWESLDTTGFERVLPDVLERNPPEGMTRGSQQRAFDEQNRQDPVGLVGFDLDAGRMESRLPSGIRREAIGPGRGSARVEGGTAATGYAPTEADYAAFREKHYGFPNRSGGEGTTGIASQPELTGDRRLRDERSALHRASVEIGGSLDDGNIDAKKVKKSTKSTYRSAVALENAWVALGGRRLGSEASDAERVRAVRDASKPYMDADEGRKESKLARSRSEPRIHSAKKQMQGGQQKRAKRARRTIDDHTAAQEEMRRLLLG